MTSQKESEETVTEKNAFLVNCDNSSETAMPFICGYCKKEFNRISEYCLHFKQHDTPLALLFHLCENMVTQADIIVTCDKCQLVFPSICMLHSHLLVCSGSGSYLYDHKRCVGCPIDDISTFMGGRTEETSEKEVTYVNTPTIDTDNTCQTIPQHHAEATDHKESLTHTCTNQLRGVQTQTFSVHTQTDGHENDHKVESGNSEVSKQIKRKRGRPKKARGKANQGIKISRVTRKSRKTEKVTEHQFLSESDQSVTDLNESDKCVIVVKEEVMDTSEDTDTVEKFENGTEETENGSEETADSAKMSDLNDSSQVVHRKSVEKEDTSSKKTTVRKRPGKKSDYPCELCGKTFQYIGKLRSHMLSHSDVKHFKCELCGTAYKYPSHLKLHMREHNEIKPFCCELCGEGFIELTRLKRHIIIKHTTDKKYKCSICEASFKFKSGLNRHFQYHNEVKMHQCEVCGQQFSRKCYLVQHVLIHTNTRRFECTEDGCGRKFYTNYQLQCHLKSHSGERPFKCSVCSAAFIQRKELRRHMKMKHGLDLDNLADKPTGQSNTDSDGAIDLSQQNLTSHVQEVPKMEFLDILLE